MSYDDNPVYNPSGYGFDTVIGTIDLSEPDWSFDYLAVLKNEKGFYLGTDSGCSCPSPWESHTADDFTGPLTADQAIEEATSLAEGWNESIYDPKGFNELIEAIKANQ